jgi:hypothetical protein
VRGKRAFRVSWLTRKVATVAGDGARQIYGCCGSQKPVAPDHTARKLRREAPGWNYRRRNPT